MKKLFFIIIQYLVLWVGGCGALPTTSPVDSYATNIVISIPSITSTVAPSPKPTFTFTPYPTLAYEVQDEFFSLLASNGNCRLPCFLGITPGTTLWTEARMILEPYAYNAHFLNDKDLAQSVAIVTTKDVDIYMTVKVDTLEDRRVNRIVTHAEFFKEDSIATQDNHLQWYSPSEVFRNHGLPDNLYLSIERGVYSIGIVYENLKAVILLTGYAKENASNKRVVCPNIGDGDIGSIKIALASPTNPIDVKTLIGYPFWEGASLFEEVTGMSIDEFYELMVSGQQPVCIEIP